MACNIKHDPEVEKAFWGEAHKRMIDEQGQLRPGVEPEDVIRAIAKDHGLGTDYVGGILSSKKLFMLTNEAWAKQAKLAELRGAAKRMVETADHSKALRYAMLPYELTRRALTIGHGGVIPFTHAKSSLFIPGEHMIFRQAVADAYSYMRKENGSARWRQDMAKLRADPKFNFWARVGLDIKLQSQHVGMGMSRWTRQLDPADRAGEQGFKNAQDLARKINHATGTVKSPPIINKIAGATMFAPKLRFSKYATVVDTVTSKFGIKRFAKLAAVNLGLLYVNDMFNQHVLNNNERVNWSNPNQADWLRMKVLGMTIPLAPTMEAAKLPIMLGTNLLDPRQHNKWKVAAREIASAAHPGANALYGAVTGTDLATGKTLPFKGLGQRIYGESRSSKKDQQIGGGEYASGYTPIWMQPVLKEMAKEGVPPDLSVKFLQSYAETILSGGAGTHSYPNVPYKPVKPYNSRR